MSESTRGQVKGSVHGFPFGVPEECRKRDQLGKVKENAHGGGVVQVGSDGDRSMCVPNGIRPLDVLGNRIVPLALASLEMTRHMPRHV